MKTIFFKTVVVLCSFLLSMNVGFAQRLPKRGTITEQIRNSSLFNPQRTIVDELLEFALDHQGIPYRHGACGSGAFDCSGFTSYVFREFGISLSRTAGGQFKNGTKVDKSNEMPGDLVFFSGRKGGSRIGHVGIVLESTGGTGFYFIHASCRRGITVSHSSETYYRRRYLSACRIIPVL